MNLFDELGKKIVSTGQVVVNKTREFADITNLKLQVKEEERKMQMTYQKLGEVYYELHKDSPDDVLAEIMEEVEQTQQRLDALNESITSMENEGKCPECGAKLGESAAFCSSCGAKVQRESEEAESDEECQSESPEEPVETEMEGTDDVETSETVEEEIVEEVEVEAEDVKDNE